MRHSFEPTVIVLDSSRTTASLFSLNQSSYVFSNYMLHKDTAAKPRRAQKALHRQKLHKTLGTRAIDHSDGPPPVSGMHVRHTMHAVSHCLFRRWALASDRAHEDVSLPLSK